MAQEWTINSKVLKTMINKKHEFWITFFGDSMLPSFNSKKILKIKVSDTDINVGDIVVYKNLSSPAGMVIHRIVEKENDNYILKGDHNNYFDGKISKNNIMGVVVDVKFRNNRIKHVKGSSIISYLSYIDAKAMLKVKNNFIANFIHALYLFILLFLRRLNYE